MSKHLLSAALIAGLGIAAFAPRAALATDGTITFNGKVTAATCTATAGTGNAVTLPTVSTTALSGVGKTAGSTLFNIVLSGCSGTMANVAANFEAGAGVNAAGRIANTGAAATAATGIDLQLTDVTGTVINIGSSSPSPAVPFTGATGTTVSIPFYVRYYATAATPGAGNVKGTVDYSIVYN